MRGVLSITSINQHCFGISTPDNKIRKGNKDFPGGAVVKNPPASAGDMVRALVQEDPTCRGATWPVRHNY